MHRPVRLRLALQLGSFVLLLAGAGGGCDNSNPTLATDPPGDTTSAPGDTVPDTPPPDTTTPPDTTGTPPDSSGTNPPGTPPTHVGLAIGEAQQPVTTWAAGDVATVYTAQPESLLARLEMARRLNLRLYISFSGSAPYLRDANGFNLSIWKQRVDRFRRLNFQSYIDDGTIAGHFLLDEADDKSNWNGKIVPVQLVEQMAAYSKSIWPTMPAIIRAFPDYLATYSGRYDHLDGVRVQYHARFGDLDHFIESNVQLSKQLGLIMIGGLNTSRGGGPESGLPAGDPDDPRPKYYMNAAQIKAWGKRFLSEPGLCGFILWEYESAYLARPDITAAIKELEEQARGLPNKACLK
ncbi:MAG TPA: hypothetical protein VFI77_06815 [Gemmatimonadales bacterium]|nr:hypothetical protein [Gemmatimonadales bacterium]